MNFHNVLIYSKIKYLMMFFRHFLQFCMFCIYGAIERGKYTHIRIPINNIIYSIIYMLFYYIRVIFSIIYIPTIAKVAKLQNILLND